MVSSRRSGFGRRQSAAVVRLLSAAGTTNVRSAIELIARRYLGVNSVVPTDLVAIAHQLDVVRFDPADVSFSGELRREGKHWSVIYGRDQSPLRRRFTIAHELAHAFFESTGPRCPRRGKDLERLCDMLAVELLMPTDSFSPAMRENGMTCDGIIKLSQRFQTSLSTTAIRCAELSEWALGHKVTVFDLDGGQQWVNWAHGLVRRGPLSGVPRPIRSVVERCVADDKIVELQQVLWLSADTRPGDYLLEWRRLGQHNRFMFVLSPFVNRTP